MNDYLRSDHRRRKRAMRQEQMRTRLERQRDRAGHDPHIVIAARQLAEMHRRRR